MVSLLLFVVGTAQASKPENPLLRKESGLTCADRARVANYYIDLGEAKAIEELVDRTSPQPKRFAISNTHACHIVRMLYFPKERQAIRPPALGSLLLPLESMPAEKWPQYPFAVQNGVWFLLAEGYALAGTAEPVGDYIKYCQSVGIFRRMPYAVPTAKESENALQNLLKSPRWKAIHWEYSSPDRSYRLDPAKVVKFLEKQTEY